MPTHSNNLGWRNRCDSAGVRWEPTKYRSGNKGSWLHKGELRAAGMKPVGLECSGFDGRGHLVLLYFVEAKQKKNRSGIHIPSKRQECGGSSYLAEQLISKGLCQN